MFKRIEDRNNNILSQDSSINSKRLAIEHVIDSISNEYTNPKIGGWIRRSALYAYENYQWPKKENQIFPKFEVLCNLEWDNLIKRARSLLYNNLDDLPNGTFNIVSDDIENCRIIKRNFRVEKNFYCSELEYDIKCNSWKEIFFITRVKRIFKNMDSHVFIYHCNLMCQNGNVITEILGSTDENNPPIFTMRSRYIEDEEVLKEFCGTESNNLSFSLDEISFIQKLNIIDTNSIVFQNAVRNSLSYFYRTYGEYTFEFGVGPINNVFGYTISVVANNKRININGNTEEVKISVYSTEPGIPDELTYEDFAKSNENSEAIKKVEEVILKLQELGVNIVYTKSEETNLSDKQFYHK